MTPVKSGSGGWVDLEMGAHFCRRTVHASCAHPGMAERGCSQVLRDPSGAEVWEADSPLSQNIQLEVISRFCFNWSDHSTFRDP